jgi:hypothetical protein
MAQRTVVVRTDDFDGKELGPSEGQTITVALDGVEYEIDLSDKNARTWATSNGIEVPARGRIPAEVIDQYKAAGM